MTVDEYFEKIKETILEYDDEAAPVAAQEALDAGVDPMDIITKAVQPAMDIIGKMYDEGEVFLPELILAGDAATNILDTVVPYISVEDQEKAVTGTVVIGVMYGDNHDIGKNLVKALLQAYGFKVIDLGVDVTVKEFISTAEKEKADIIASSTLITTSMPYQRQMIQLLKDSNRRDKFFVILGGGPITPKWTAEIGADGYGNNAQDAVALCSKLMSDGKNAPLDEPVIIGAVTR
ncbi:MAG: corrinoid protein [Anaerolineales bacterium]|nr:corrinoid protein [Anaerolineales bacterium]